MFHEIFNIEGDLKKIAERVPQKGIIQKVNGHKTNFAKQRKTNL